MALAPSFCHHDQGQIGCLGHDQSRCRWLRDKTRTQSRLARLWPPFRGSSVGPSGGRGKGDSSLAGVAWCLSQVPHETRRTPFRQALRMHITFSDASGFWHIIDFKWLESQRIVSAVQKGREVERREYFHPIDIDTVADIYFRRRPPRVDQNSLSQEVEPGGNGLAGFDLPRSGPDFPQLNAGSARIVSDSAKFA